MKIGDKKVFVRQQWYRFLEEYHFFTTFRSHHDAGLLFTKVQYKNVKNVFAASKYIYVVSAIELINKLVSQKNSSVYVAKQFKGKRDTTGSVIFWFQIEFSHIGFE